MYFETCEYDGSNTYQSTTCITPSSFPPTEAPSGPSLEPTHTPTLAPTPAYYDATAYFAVEYFESCSGSVPPYEIVIYSIGVCFYSDASSVYQKYNSTGVVTDGSFYVSLTSYSDNLGTEQVSQTVSQHSTTCSDNVQYSYSKTYPTFGEGLVFVSTRLFIVLSICFLVADILLVVA